MLPSLNQSEERDPRLCDELRGGEFVYTESTALLTALDWTGLVWTGSDGTGTPPHEAGVGVGGSGGGLTEFRGGRDQMG